MNDGSRTPSTPSHSRLPEALARLVATHADVVRVVRAGLWPLVDLAIRLVLAESYFSSGITKVANWSTALYLSANEYPVSWMDPVSAAYVGVSIELAAAVLLALGLFARPAALAMMALALVVQANYVVLDTNLFLAALFGWYVVHGAGRVSLDHLLGRGLADSALPLAAPIGRSTAWLRSRGTAAYLGLVRLWLGAGLLADLALGATSAVDGSGALAAWLPVATASSWPPWLALSAGVALCVGAGTRYAALTLLLLGSGIAVMHGIAADAVLLGATLSLVAIHGAGWLSFDTAAAALLRHRFPQLDGRPAFSLDGLPRVVIIGAGFGGLACATALGRSRVSVTLIDRGNHHLFQPLLYQVATAALSPGDIAAPIRPIFRGSFNTSVLFGEVTGVDPAGRRVLLGEQAVPYDYLVIASGASHSYFGSDRWRPYAPGLKRIEDATEIRRRLLTAFELAEGTHDEAERLSLLTFLIVGGGPTGVELAGAIAELARFGMEKDFRNFDPATARVILVQSAPRILPTFDERLSARAQSALEQLGVEVRVGSRVEDIGPEGVIIGGQKIAARTVLWAAGVTASPAARWLGADADPAGRIKVAADLGVPGFDGVYAIGDTALSMAWNGSATPGLAPAAKQAGAHVARTIAARVAGARFTAQFRYRHLGSLATIGRKAAVADFGGIRLWGAPAWWLWGAIHVGFLVGVRNRLATMINWFWSYLTFGAGIRLITGSPDASAPSAER